MYHVYHVILFLSRKDGKNLKIPKLNQNSEFMEVDETLHNVRSGNLPDFTRLRTILPDQMPFPNL